VINVYKFNAERKGWDDMEKSAFLFLIIVTLVTNKIWRSEKRLSWTLELRLVGRYIAGLRLMDRLQIARGEDGRLFLIRRKKSNNVFLSSWISRLCASSERK